MLETDEAYTLSYSLHIWRRKELRLKGLKGLLEISRDKRTKQYDLRNYVIRESKNSEYNCFVLESINGNVTEKNKVVRVGFKGLGMFQEWFLAVKGAVIRMERERLREELMRWPNVKGEERREEQREKEIQQRDERELPNFGSTPKPSFK